MKQVTGRGHSGFSPSSGDRSVFKAGCWPSLTVSQPLQASVSPPYLSHKDLVDKEDGAWKAPGVYLAWSRGLCKYQRPLLLLLRLVSVFLAQQQHVSRHVALLPVWGHHCLFLETVTFALAQPWPPARPEREQ